jgi:hypothetical protein
VTSKDAKAFFPLRGASKKQFQSAITANRWPKINSQTDFERSSRMKHQPFSTSATAQRSYELAHPIVITFEINNTGNETV